MLKKVLFISLVAICLCSASNLQAQNLLMPENNPGLNLILNNLEVIASIEKKFSIKVIRVRENGECDGTPQSCPQESLYIAVSEYGEYPDQTVYVLPRAYGWHFDRWVAPPKGEGPDDFAVLRLTKEVVSQDISKGWWDQETYELRVNPWKGYLDFKSRSKAKQDRGQPARAGKATSRRGIH
jgi:hypothetical protein